MYTRPTLGTVDYALLIIAQATTASQTLERLYLRQTRSLSLAILQNDILDNIESRREPEERASFPTGSSCYQTTAKRTNRMKEQEFRMALKSGGPAGLGKRHVKLLWL
jgi:hypothetical protein